MHPTTFIAGGSKGLGAALLNRFQHAKHQVIEFSRSGSSPSHINCDFDVPEQAAEVFQHTFLNHSNNTQADQSTTTQINLIINTAILSPFGALAKTNNQAIKQHLNINIESTLMLIQAFNQAFQSIKAKKTIAYISSGAAQRAIPGLSLYSASKAFFERLVDTLAEEQRSLPHPIQCMVINPGVMNTDMQAEIRSQTETDFPMLPWWQSLYEKGQLAEPKDIAEICFELITTSGESGGYYTAQQYLRTSD